MFTVNVDVCDVLVNGARGIVSGIINNNDKVLGADPGGGSGCSSTSLS